MQSAVGIYATRQRGCCSGGATVLRAKRLLCRRYFLSWDRQPDHFRSRPDPNRLRVRVWFTLQSM